MNATKYNDFIRYLSDPKRNVPEKYTFTDDEKTTFMTEAGNFGLSEKPTAWSHNSTSLVKVLTFKEPTEVAFRKVPTISELRNMILSIHGSYDQGVHNASVNAIYEEIFRQGYNCPGMKYAIRDNLEPFCRKCYHYYNSIYLIDVQPVSSEYKEKLRVRFGLTANPNAPASTMGIGRYHDILAEHTTTGAMHSVFKSLIAAIGEFIIFVALSKTNSQKMQPHSSRRQVDTHALHYYTRSQTNIKRTTRCFFYSGGYEVQFRLLQYEVLFKLKNPTPVDYARWERLYGREEVDREVTIARDNNNWSAHGPLMIQVCSEVLGVDIALGWFPRRQEKEGAHIFERFFARGDFDYNSANGMIVLLSRPATHDTDRVSLVLSMDQLELV